MRSLYFDDDQWAQLVDIAESFRAGGEFGVSASELVRRAVAYALSEWDLVRWRGRRG